MNMPGYTAELSLRHESGRYHGNHIRTVAPHLVTAQLKCPCPPGLFGKASSLCDSPAHGGHWCDILGRCFDCFA
jgi:hypothetical protein